MYEMFIHVCSQPITIVDSVLAGTNFGVTPTRSAVIGVRSTIILVLKEVVSIGNVCRDCICRHAWKAS